MKSIFFIIIGIILYVDLDAQIIRTGKEEFPVENDSVVLVPPQNLRGDIQWQATSDSINWININSTLGDTLAFSPDSSASYRLVIREENCNPIYSDTIQIDLDIKFLINGQEYLFNQGFYSFHSEFCGDCLVSYFYEIILISPDVAITNWNTGEMSGVGDIIYLYIYNTIPSFANNKYEFDILDNRDKISKCDCGDINDDGLINEDDCCITLAENEAFIDIDNSFFGLNVDFEDPESWEFGVDLHDFKSGTVQIFKLNDAVYSFNFETVSGKDQPIKGTINTVLEDINYEQKDTIKDADGNVYNIIKIGTQEWMAENLRTTRFNDGTFIPLVTDGTEWSNLTTPAHCWYDNDSAQYSNPYGAFYNWYAVDTMSNGNKNICPIGWHVPAMAEWDILTDYLADNGYWGTEGTALKATSGWNNDGNGTDDYGFAALPGGLGGGGYYNLGSGGYWWSSSEGSLYGARGWMLLDTLECSLMLDGVNKATGLSVRCIKDGQGLPKADFISSRTIITQGDTVQFIDQSSNTPTNWDWDFGDGETSTQQNPIHIFKTPGTYSVSLVAANSFGSDSKTKTDFIKVVELETDTFTDLRDNHQYETLKIGDQWWMAENLAYLPSVRPSSIISETEPYCYVYDFEDTIIADAKATDNYQIYGVLYNWPASLDACPEGWHLPADEEWTILTDYLGGANIAGGKLKETGTTHWVGNLSATNTSGFTALPGGWMSPHVTFGDFRNLHYVVDFWSSTYQDITHAWIRGLNYNTAEMSRSLGNKAFGFNIRCVKDSQYSPIADFTASLTNIKEGDSVYFTDQSTNGAISWSWDFGDGNKSIQQNPVHTYYVAGNYTVRLAASNSYGSGIKIKTNYVTVSVFIKTDSVTDHRDGHVYKTVRIGDQWWMAENLATTKFADSTDIPLITDNSTWSSLSSPGFCWYKNDSATYAGTYGALYNWYVVNTNKLCPTGWHVPANDEWTKLVNYLIANGYNYDGTTTENKIAKALASDNGWMLSSATGSVGNTDYPEKRNATSFTALPGGDRNTSGEFFSLGTYGFWWSSTESSTIEAYSRYLYYYYTNLRIIGIANKVNGYSVRCLKDN